ARVLRRALAPQGLGLLHTISRTTRRNAHDPFIQRYIFPGSSQPALSDVVRSLELVQLAVTDVENIAHHYRPTTQYWLDRFGVARASLDESRYPQRFQRMWEYYLACGVAAASESRAGVYQIVLYNGPITHAKEKRV